MNLRTFTLREMFLWIFFCKHRGAVVFGRMELYPGADVAISVMLPIPTE